MLESDRAETGNQVTLEPRARAQAASEFLLWNQDFFFPDELIKQGDHFGKWKHRTAQARLSLHFTNFLFEYCPKYTENINKSLNYTSVFMEDEVWRKYLMELGESLVSTWASRSRFYVSITYRDITDGKETVWHQHTMSSLKEGKEEHKKWRSLHFNLYSHPFHVFPLTFLLDICKRNVHS